MAEAAKGKIKRLHVVEHDGRRVLLIDFSRAGAAEIEAELAGVQRYITSKPVNSVLTLTDWTEAEITKKVLAAIKKVAAYDRPHVRRAAIVASEKSHEQIKALEMFSARKISVFETRQQALVWLTKED